MPILPHVFGDHPRGCGAHYGTRKRARCLLGSSPRVRGSHLRQGKDDSRLGIIPAGAGLTAVRLLSHSRRRDHPRGCGAHHWIFPSAVNWLGSSPRVRGSRYNHRDHSADCGIIPAGAGLTRQWTGDLRGSWDHPRGCGAHMAVTAIIATGLGSSPRVRGSQLLHKNALEGIGIIPAGAGLTLATVRRPTADWDHPRGCGAHYNMQIIRARETGSSPRVRGSLSHRDDSPASCGIIPAGAGLTGLC